MICWGERNGCGIFIDRSTNDRCDCLRDYCIRDYEPDQRIMVNESELDEVIDHLYLRGDEHLIELSDMMNIKSISGSKEYETQSKQILERLAQRLHELEFDVEVVQIKTGSDEKPAHYVLFANYFSTPAKNIMLVYGHVDVPPVDKNDPWETDPFSLTQKDEVLYGRGLTSAKGPVLCWIQAAESWLEETNDLPVNLRIIIDSNRYSSSRELRHLLKSRKDFFRSVDLLVGITNLWVTPQIPMITTNHSGYIYFELEVKEKRQTSEDSNRNVLEPMSELCLLMNTLTDTKNGILIDGLQRHVLPMTQHDFDLISQAEVGITNFKEKLDTKSLPHEQSQADFLKHRWCMPGLSMHTVHHPAADGSLRDFNKVKRVVANFSVKLVPDQSIEYVSFMIRDHLDRAYIRLKCLHPAYLHVLDKLKPLNEARNAPFNLSAQRAYERVYECQAFIPDTITICEPILNELRKYCMADAQVLGLPFCSVHMKPNQVNESMTRDEYQKDLELFATLLYEVALVPAECKCTAIKDFCYNKGKSTDRDFIRMLEPRHPALSHVLYELDELELDKPPPVTEALKSMREVLLGVTKSKDKLHL